METQREVSIHSRYRLQKEERKARGEKGRQWAMSEEAGFTAELMANRASEAMEELFTTWKPREKYQFIADTDYKKKTLKHSLIY